MWGEGGRLSSLFSSHQLLVNQALTLNSLVPPASFCSFVEAISLSPLFALWWSLAWHCGVEVERWLVGGSE